MTLISGELQVYFGLRYYGQFKRYKKKNQEHHYRGGYQIPSLIKSIKMKKYNQIRTQMETQEYSLVYERLWNDLSEEEDERQYSKSIKDFDAAGEW